MAASVNHTKIQQTPAHTMSEDAADITDVERPNPGTLVMNDQLLFADIVKELSPRDLSAVCGAAPLMRTTVHELVVPPRLKAATATAKSSKFTIIDCPPEMSPVEYLFQAEDAAAEAMNHRKEEAKKARSGLVHFLQHIDTEAAMRGQLSSIQPLTEAIMAKMGPDPQLMSDDEVLDLHQQAADLEEQVLMSSMASMFGLDGAPARPGMNMMLLGGGGVVNLPAAMHTAGGAGQPATAIDYRERLMNQPESVLRLMRQGGFMGGGGGGGSGSGPAPPGVPLARSTTPRTKVSKVKPNEPCTCGSGKKYKKCCAMKA